MHHGPELRVVVVLCIALAVGALTRALGKRLRVPYTVAMLLAGVAAGGLLARFGDELHTLAALREGHAVTADLILFVFLPALVFESAFALDVHAFRKNLGFVALLAVPALVVATGLTAAWMVGLTSPALGVGGWAWGWAPALVFGALISATDPVAVVAILREVGAPKRLGLLIEGESLLNDGTAIVVFGLLIGLLKGAEEVSLGHAVLELGRVAGGGVVLGLVLGGLTMAWLGRTFDDPLVEITLTILLAYAAMILAEAVLHVSGVLAIVTAGVTLAGPGRTRISPRVAHFLHQFWEMLAYVANTVIFFLVGVVIVANLPLASLSSVLVGVGAYVGAMLVRLVVTFAVRPLGNRLVDTPVTTRAAAVMTWGGLRGAVSLALALLLSQQAGIDATLRAQILTVTAGVVLGTILLNGSTTGALLRKLGFTAIGPAEALAEARASEQVLAEVQQRVADADDDPALRTVPWLPVREALAARREALADELDAARERFEAAAGEERERALWRRALQLERRAYREAYQEGTLRASALEILEHEIDAHLDRLEQGELAPPASRLRVGGLAQRLERLLRAFGPTSWLAFRRIAVRYDLARLVAEAAQRVRRLAEQASFDDREAAAHVDAAYRRYRADAKRELEALRLYQPEITAAVERRLAERIALSFERSALEKVLAQGGMPDSAASRARARLEARAEQLYHRVDRGVLPETADLCRETALFADLGEDAIAELASATDEQLFDEGEWLFHEGDRGDAMYIVARGVVEVVHEGEDGEEEVVAVLGGGDLLGEMALLTGEPRTAGARAATPVTVGRIPRRAFTALMERHPDVQEKVWAAHGRRLLDNRLRAGLFGEIEPEWRRALVAGSEVRQVGEGEEQWGGAGGHMIVSGEVEHGGERRGAGSFVEPGDPYRPGADARVLELPRPTMMPGPPGSMRPGSMQPASMQPAPKRESGAARD